MNVNTLEKFAITLAAPVKIEQRIAKTIPMATVLLSSLI